MEIADGDAVGGCAAEGAKVDGLDVDGLAEGVEGGLVFGVERRFVVWEGDPTLSEVMLDMLLV